MGCHRIDAAFRWFPFVRYSKAGDPVPTIFTMNPRLPCGGRRPNCRGARYGMLGRGKRASLAIRSSTAWRTASDRSWGRLPVPPSFAREGARSGLALRPAALRRSSSVRSRARWTRCRAEPGFSFASLTIAIVSKSPARRRTVRFEFTNYRTGLVSRHNELSRDIADASARPTCQTRSRGVCLLLPATGRTFENISGMAGVSASGRMSC